MSFSPVKPHKSSLSAPGEPSQRISRVCLSTLVVILLTALLTACVKVSAPQPQLEERGLQSTPTSRFTPLPIVSSADTTLQSTPNPGLTPPPPIGLIPPPLIGDEPPLHGNIPEIPNVYLIPSRQSKAALAAYLKTTLEELDRVNPRLPDPISPGTLVVIPPVHRAGQGETLSDIAEKIDLPEQLLRAMNPDLEAQDTLAEGTVLVVPPLYVVPADMSLSSLADTLDVDEETLLSVNQSLVDQREIGTGTVLIVPPEVLRREESP